MSERGLLVGLLLLPLLVATLSGCSRPAEPKIAIRILSITQENHAVSESSEAQVSFNVSMNLTNIGTIDYRIAGDDFLLETDTGLGAFVGGWRRLSPEEYFASDRWLLKPGGAADFELFAYQLGHSYGNLTTVRFRDGPVQPVMGEA